MWQMAFTMLTDTTLPDTNLQSLTKVNQKSHVQRETVTRTLVADLNNKFESCWTAKENEDGIRK